MQTTSRVLNWCAGLLLLVGPANAHEGMWLPTLLKGIEGDMHTAGLKITAEDIYSINEGSIKDAIVLFGGGCTAEIISDKGLILTNHHCGYSRIQDHSSLEKDYLKNGFWAMSSDGELRNPGLTATFIVRMEEVTERIVPELNDGMSETERREAISKLSIPIVRDATEGTRYDAVVRPFNYGNSYFVIVTETFKDVRLVGAPPSAIGKFGGDTDNWMWPRHTGDFSLFRIYAGKDNAPADPSDDNVPYEPRHVLPISLKGVAEDDFAMIFGFPGNTQQYLTSYAVQHIVEVQDPLRISMRTAGLDVINKAMRQSDLTRIQYAAKQSSISNAWKKWIGELRGLKELDVMEEKRSYESAYRERAEATGRTDQAQVLDELKELYARYAPYATARDLFIELVYYGPEIIRFTERFAKLAEQHEELHRNGDLDEEVRKLKEGIPGFFKDHDSEVDRELMKALLPIYRAHLDPDLSPSVFQEIDERYRGNTSDWVDAKYSKSMFTDKTTLEKALDGFNARMAKKMRSDPIMQVARNVFTNFLEEVRPEHAAIGDSIENAMRRYVKGMMELFPEHTYWPDANSTLRLSYGKVEGSEPRDAVVFGAFSTLDGVMEKHVPSDPDFNVPPRLMELHASKDYGRYGVDGSMPVCFTSSLHTTGGNSGSPILNRHGELVGLNFDRTWESTMSDIRFDPAKCRNIGVDIRYVLFIIDKYAGAGHLVEEMQIGRLTNELQTIELPLHR